MDFDDMFDFNAAPQEAVQQPATDNQWDPLNNDPWEAQAPAQEQQEQQALQNDSWGGGQQSWGTAEDAGWETQDQQQWPEEQPQQHQQSVEPQTQEIHNNEPEEQHEQQDNNLFNQLEIQPTNQENKEEFDFFEDVMPSTQPPTTVIPRQEIDVFSDNIQPVQPIIQPVHQEAPQVPVQPVQPQPPVQSLPKIQSVPQMQPVQQMQPPMQPVQPIQIPPPQQTKPVEAQLPPKTITPEPQFQENFKPQTQKFAPIEQITPSQNSDEINKLTSLLEEKKAQFRTLQREIETFNFFQPGQVSTQEVQTLAQNFNIYLQNNNILELKAQNKLYLSQIQENEKLSSKTSVDQYHYYQTQCSLLQKDLLQKDEEAIRLIEQNNIQLRKKNDQISKLLKQIDQQQRELIEGKK